MHLPGGRFLQPTRVRSSVLLPEPEPPITTRVSPCRFRSEAMQNLAVAVLHAQIARRNDGRGGRARPYLTPRASVEQDGEDEIDQAPGAMEITTAG
jgi:hypothetical protein